MAGKELRHFMVFQEGTDAKARIDFSDLTSSVHAKVSIELEVALANSATWDHFVDDVRGLLKYASPRKVKT